MSIAMDGTMRALDEGVELRFERDFAQPIEKVWASLTEPSKLKDWFAEAEIDLRLGGRVYLKGDEIESTITELDPPRLIQYGWKSPEWDGGQIRWELAPTSNGTHLVFTHRFIPLTEEQAEEFRARNDLPEGWDPLPSNLAGWHVILGRLADALEGRPYGSSLDWRASENRDEQMKEWAELNEHYRKVLSR
jgi:uncharacterized protein YndB with AHSA1/START domain